MTFAEPVWFAALLLVPVLYLCMWRGDTAVRLRLERLVAPRLRSRLVEDVSVTGRWLKAIARQDVKGMLALMDAPFYLFSLKTIETRQALDMVAAIRGDLAGPRWYPGYLYSAAVLLDRSVDLALTSTTLTRDSEPSWRAWLGRVERLRIPD